MLAVIIIIMKAVPAGIFLNILYIKVFWSQICLRKAATMEKFLKGVSNREGPPHALSADSHQRHRPRLPFPSFVPCLLCPAGILCSWRILSFNLEEKGWSYIQICNNITVLSSTSSFYLLPNKHLCIYWINKNRHLMNRALSFAFKPFEFQVQFWFPNKCPPLFRG